MNKNIYHLRLVITSLVLWSWFLTAETHAQTQSGRVYEFINLPSTARITALGGYAVPGLDQDLGMALYYPSLLTSDLPNQLSLNFVDYFGDISYGTAAMSYGFEKAGNFTFSVQYINYGSFIEADEFGNKLGEFNAGEYAIGLGWGRELSERFSIGSNLKSIFSTFEEYSSFGLAADVSFSYLDPERMIAAGLVFRNIGRQITHYHDNVNESLPFDIVLGLSKKLINAPLRFSFVAHNLHNYDLTYDELVPSGQTIIGATENERSTAQERFSEVSDKLLRHAVFGIEFMPTENFIAGIGYNYRRRQEMKVDTRMSTVGLSWGVGIKISHFMFHYGRSNYHLAGAPNHFSVSTNLESLFFRPVERPSI
ncbi:MAG: hypothetical protein EA361_11120 [Bacteroidetes bacterium]|nr:MAG: hypothetical protein EA361_11120 [Bacteroidota bacterium]